ncbi:hypothetical protein SAMD00079811_76060 (plasmid) [Scytonema sp. HK-05]|uniref:hypothetical protein n=1 Tax=Scytonema sp. HK-05 TaxID=1137095 RepID=UPI000936A016|nr:hypothetical protein [Scytonema sp. HK-05]OKH54470.1 hypothetical protein NIES2130_28410 [Scytonema sp. HK-05]BAY49977.1 hypothetical protein SAMD00079811_76060 [Scytonema sp. HK-05]
MKLSIIIGFVVAILLSIVVPTLVNQAPFAVCIQNIRVNFHDRVYTADQTSNTVSVHNPQTNQLLGVIRLGEITPENLSL